jgi:hypothetical protein
LPAECIVPQPCRSWQAIPLAPACNGFRPAFLTSPPGLAGVVARCAVTANNGLNKSVALHTLSFCRE